jgi:serine/threonine protein kinase
LRQAVEMSIRTYSHFVVLYCVHTKSKSMLSEPIIKAPPAQALIDSSLSLDPTWSFVESFQHTNYEIQEELGRGTSSVVFRCRDRSSGGAFALKLMRTPRTREMESRLTREIEKLIRLDHPNVVSIIDKGVIKDHVYLVMNLVEGCSIADLFNDSPSLITSYWLADLKNDWSRLAIWGKEIASALEYLHSENIFHGNLKPTNILVDREGRCLIADCGLASVMEHDFEGSQGGGVARFLRYRALEQLCGITDQRSDVHSLGRTLYELACLAGELPPQSYNRVELPPLCVVNPNVPADLGQVIDKACDKVADHRFQNARELVAVFQRFLEGKSPCDRRHPGARMSSQEFKALQHRRNRNMMLGTAGVFALSFVSVFAFNVISKKSEATNSEHQLTPAQDDSQSQENDVTNIKLNKEGATETAEDSTSPSIAQDSENTPDRQLENEPTQLTSDTSQQAPPPGNIEELANGSQESSQNTSEKVRALMIPLNNSGLSSEEKLKGTQTLERFAKAVLNNKVPSEQAERLLAALFLGNPPKLEQMVEIQVPERAFASWLVLIEQTFANEFDERDNPPSSP